MQTASHTIVDTLICYCFACTVIFMTQKQREKLNNQSSILHVGNGFVIFLKITLTTLHPFRQYNWLAFTKSQDHVGQMHLLWKDVQTFTPVQFPSHTCPFAIVRAESSWVLLQTPTGCSQACIPLLLCVGLLTEVLHHQGSIECPLEQRTPPTETLSPVIILLLCS